MPAIHCQGANDALAVVEDLDVLLDRSLSEFSCEVGVMK
jgi:hypothetical protein